MGRVCPSVGRSRRRLWRRRDELGRFCSRFEPRGRPWWRELPGQREIKPSRRAAAWRLSWLPREPVTTTANGFEGSELACSDPGAAFFSEAGDSTSLAAVAAMTRDGVSNIAKQHYEWAHELETVDQKQADLVVLQWKLVRNQTGMLAQQLLELKKHVQTLQRHHDDTSRKVEETTRDSEAFEDRVKAFVRQLFEKGDHNITRMRQDLDQEVQRRDEGDLELKRRLDQMSADITRKLDGEQPLEHEVRNLKVELSAQNALLPGLKEHVQVSVQEMRTGLDHVADHCRKIKEDFERDRRDRLQTHEELHDKVQGYLGRERTERELLHSTLNTLVQSSVSSHAEELSALRGRLQEIEDRTHKAHKDHMAVLDAKFMEPVSKLQHIERRFEHVQASIAQECESRASLHEVFDQMLKNERTKLTNLITQKANIARLDCDEIQRALQEKLDKEMSEREVGDEGHQATLARSKAELTEHIDAMQTKCQALMADAHSALAEARGAEQMYRKLESEVSSVKAATADWRRDAMQGLADERAAREARDQQIEDQLDWLGDVHDRMHDIFRHKQHVKTGVSARGSSTTTAASGTPWQLGSLGDPSSKSAESVTRPMEPIARALGSTPLRAEPFGGELGSTTLRSPRRDYH